MSTIVFEIEQDFIDLGSVLKATAICATGGEAKHLIVGGHVVVDGRVEQRRRRKLRAGSVVECRGQRVQLVTTQA
jgi:ribosome-associated protein